MSFRHVAPRRGAKRLSKHGHEAGHALVAEVGSDLLDRSTAENAFEPGYLDYVRNPANGYDSQRLPIDEGNGNEFTVRTF